MRQTAKTRRSLIENRPAFIVIDIQAETFCDRTDEAIPTVPDNADRMLKAHRVIEDCIAGSSEDTHKASLRAMEYPQSGARYSRRRVLAALDECHSGQTDAA